LAYAWKLSFKPEYLELARESAMNCCSHFDEKGAKEHDCQIPIAAMFVLDADRCLFWDDHAAKVERKLP
jgi:hypothetical protein